MNIDKSLKKKIICTICAFLLIAFSLVSFPGKAAFDGEILRFHVIANSDSPEDQALKLKVRDRVLEVFKSIENECTNAKDAEKAAIRHSSLLREAALDVIDSEGYNYNVTVNCGIYPFPQKSYGNVTLPEGNYNAVRVVIGEGKGQNWWCVMYPPLCFVNETAAFDNEALGSLSEETRNQITQKPKINVRFKFMELFNSIF